MFSYFKNEATLKPREVFAIMNTPRQEVNAADETPNVFDQTASKKTSSKRKRDQQSSSDDDVDNAELKVVFNNFYEPLYKKFRKLTQRLDYLSEFYTALEKSLLVADAIDQLKELLESVNKRKKNLYCEEALAYFMTDPTLHWKYNGVKVEGGILVDCRYPVRLLERGYFEDKELGYAKKQLQSLGFTHERISRS